MKDFKKVNKQLNKEALLTIGLFVFFFLWWYICAYFLSDVTWTVFGLPAWFFMSCCVGWIICCVGVWLLVKKGFKDVDLDQFKTEEKDGDQ